MRRHLASGCRLAVTVLGVLAVLLVGPWHLLDTVPGRPPPTISPPISPPISVLVIHRRLPDLGKGCDARLVTLLSDLAAGGADVSYLALNASKLALSNESAR